MNRTVRLLALASVFAAGAPVQARLSQDRWSHPFSGVARLERVTAEPLAIHALVVDLCTPGLRIRATAPGEGPRTVSAFGALVGAEAVINADFFHADFRTLGLALGNGARWPGSADDPLWGFVAFGEGRTRVSPPAEWVEPIEPWMSEVVGGVPEIVIDGLAVETYERRFCHRRHPRTGLGLSEDRRSLVVAVVEGRSDRSAGMTCHELGALMVELGAHDAINLDGGGSSALWLRGDGVVNLPSDGFERVVANHLAIVGHDRTGVSACPMR